MQRAKPRFEALDALRGVAAMAIVLWHVDLHALVGRRPVSTHAYLAVDLFFVISGFVLAHAYGAGLSRGEGFGAFVRARLVRLYPMHVAGALLGLAALVLVWPAMAARLGAGGFTALAALAAGFLPWVFGGQGGVAAFPLNPPSWTLSLEVWGSVLFAILAPRLRPRVLAAVIAAAGVVLTAVAFAGQGLNHGWTQGDLAVGWARFAFAFCAGLALHRLWAAGRLRLPSLPDWAPALGLAIVLALPRAGDWNGAFDLLAVLVAFPLLTALAAGARTTRLCGGPLAFGALLSYPIYATHTAVVDLTCVAARALGAPQALGPAVAALALAAAIAVAWAAERWLDRPLRAWLTRRRTPAGTPLIRPAT